ncbi:MAG: PAS domain S-box protein [Candidatus Manganitrophaceae bacterium]|nr:MAG: PAS domain S-box protein [Candidatus Manganitrophaceae bacterium]
MISVILLSGVSFLAMAIVWTNFQRRKKMPSSPSNPAPPGPILSNRNDQSLLDAIEEAVVIVDAEWKIVHCNPACASLFGYSPDELIGKPFRFLYAEETEAGGPEGSFRKNSVLKMISYRKKSGDIFPGETRFSSIQYNAALPNGVAALIRDDTPGAEAEAKIRQLNETLERRVADRTAQLNALNVELQTEMKERKRIESHLAAEHAITQILAQSGSLGETAPKILRIVCESFGWDLGIFWKTNDQVRVLTCVETWQAPTTNPSEFEAISREKIFWPGEGFPGQVWTRGEPVWLTEVADVADFLRAVHAVEMGIHSALAFPIRSGSGVSGVMEFLSREIRRPDVELLQMLSNIGTQIGQFIDRKEAERALLESETRKRAIFESALDCMITVDHEGKIIEFNAAAEQTFGFTKSDLLGRSMADRIIPPHLRKRHRDAFERYLSTGEGPILNRRIETTGIRADGSEFPIELTITRIPLEGPPVFQGFLRDITERKRVEAERQDLLERELSARSEAEAARGQLAFLSDASGLLAASLDYETTLERLARLSVPFLADGCIIDMIEGERVRRVAVAATDPEKAAIGRELMRRYPPLPRGKHPLQKVLESGRSELIPEISEELLTAIAQSESHLQIARGLGIRSAMVVPLLAQGRVLGALSFVSIESGRRYGPKEVAFAEELARRAVVAVENARLYRSAQEEIAERKRIEETLNQREKHFRALIEQSSDGIVLVTASGLIVYASPSTSRLLGYAVEEFIGRNALDLIHSEDRERNEEMLSFLVRRPGGRVTMEYRIQHKDGSWRWMEGIGTNLFEEPSVGAIVINYRDMTDRKRGEEALAAEKERLAVTLGSIGDGVIATDVTGRVLFINRTAEELSGWFQEEAVGRPLSEVFHIVHEKSRADCENPVEKVLATGQVVALANHTVLIAKDGREHAIADSGAPIRNREGRIIGVVLVFRDVTEKQRMQEELLRASTLESVGLLAGGVAHDFNNLLTAILGNLSLAMLSLDERSEIYERLGQAEKASMRARDLAQQLLTFAKGGAPVKKTASMVDLLQDSADFVVRGSNVRCEFSIQENLWPVEVDEGQVGQVIHNLILNAQQSMPEGGIIQIGAENKTIEEVKGLPLKGRDYIHITIRDFGIGIPKEHLSKIFDPYFTTKQKGSGLGLSTSYSIIKKHDGTMTVDSELGKGSTFSIYLPAFPNAAIPKDKEMIEIASLVGRGRILVMDDEEIIRDVFQEMLGRLGYEVTLAKEGLEAVSLYRSARESGHPFDAVIMDLTIPGGVGGKEAIRKLREIDPEVKAIVSSGYSNDPLAASFTAYGFSDFVAKPFRMEELGRVVKRIVSKNR